MSRARRLAVRALASAFVVSSSACSTFTTMFPAYHPNARSSVGQLDSPEKWQNKVTYDQLAVQMGCDVQAMDREWATQKRVVVPAGGDPCVAFGRFGIPDRIDRYATPTAQGVTVMWAEGLPQPYMIAIVQTPTGWVISAIQY